MFVVYTLEPRAPSGDSQGDPTDLGDRGRIVNIITDWWRHIIDKHVRPSCTTVVGTYPWQALISSTRPSWCAHRRRYCDIMYMSLYRRIRGTERHTEFKSITSVRFPEHVTSCIDHKGPLNQSGGNSTD